MESEETKGSSMRAIAIGKPKPGSIRARTLATLLVALCIAFVAAAPLAGAADKKATLSYGGVFLGLTDAERASLERGDLVVHPLKDAQKLNLAYSDAETQEIQRRVKAIQPNYTAEFMAAIPMRDEAQTKTTINQIVDVLSDVNGYVDIPYWSKQQKTTYPLFDKMQVLQRGPLKDEKSKSNTPNASNANAAESSAESIQVLQHMEPFDDFRARYDYRVTSSALRFSAVNEDTIVYSYQHFSAVSPGNMIWELYVFPVNGNLCIYGVGAIRAFDMFGIFRSRLEPSLMGRVEAFFGYVAKTVVHR